MRKLLLLTGAAALAIAMPAAAEKGGKGGGGGHGQGGGHAAHVQQGGGGGKAHGGGGGHAAHAPQLQRNQPQAFHAPKPQKAERQAFRGGRGSPHKAERRIVRNDMKRQERVLRDRFEPRRDFARFRDDDGHHFAGGERGCPPGLAMKNNGCLPPGQAKKLFGRGDRLQRDWFSGYRIPASYSAFYQDTPEHYYRYDDNGYIYQVNRNSDLISSIIPLFGGGFAVGQPLPAGYDVYNVPFQYRDVYSDNDDYLYRYGDNAIYQVDSGSGLIEGIVALLGGDLNVGQPLPDGYDVYNVPMDYRDRYYDTDDYEYRYADGNIYQVDAKTQLIQAIVEMIV